MQRRCKAYDMGDIFKAVEDIIPVYSICSIPYILIAVFLYETFHSTYLVNALLNKMTNFCTQLSFAQIIFYRLVVIS